MAKSIVLYEEELEKLIDEAQKMKSLSNDKEYQHYYEGMIRAYQELLWQTEDNE